MNARFKCFPGCLTLSTTDRASVSPPQARVTITFTTVSRLTKNLSRQACPEPCRRDAKHAKKDPLSFRPKGEIFLISLASARDDGPRPVTFAAFASLREQIFLRDLRGENCLLVAPSPRAKLTELLSNRRAHVDGHRRSLAWRVASGAAPPVDFI